MIKKLNTAERKINLALIANRVVVKNTFDSKSNVLNIMDLTAIARDL